MPEADKVKFHSSDSGKSLGKPSAYCNLRKFSVEIVGDLSTSTLPKPVQNKLYTSLLSKSLPLSH